MNDAKLKEDTRFVSRLTRETLALILAGGQGIAICTNSPPGVRSRACISAASSRIIDFALSNCINSGIRRIGVFDPVHRRIR